MTGTEPGSGETQASRGILAERTEDRLLTDTAPDPRSAGQRPAPKRDPNLRYRLRKAAHPTKTEVDPLVELLVECCPHLPRPVAQSLLCEALDHCADVLLDAEWARQRRAVWPEAIRSAHNRHVGHSYAERRAAEERAA